MALELALSLAAPALAPAFVLWGSPITWLEIVAVMLSIAMVWCNLRVDATAWPLAIAASALYGVLFAAARLYGEATLQVLFIAVAFWGWWQWLRGRGDDGQALRVHVMSRRQALGVACLALAAWPLLGALLHRYTDSDVPYLDALPTTLSVAGQFLLGRKLIENWLVWLVVNVFSVGLFALKGLWLTTALYALFAALSVAGWRAWRMRLASA
ncbi:MAG: Nicotinamide riboside transporter PnuC [Burkholderiaceae bacterium]|nr:Nicotinamide riboside transporter PnuC [Burkholderiaceae bacterium]